ncbi:MAG: hypothetical protein M3139_12690 [Bacteroidota bacterium]|nr:hypothetical protein [Bacteroidota bacterium]
MKLLAFLSGLTVIGILLLLKNSGKMNNYQGYLQPQLTDEDVWLGN